MIRAEELHISLDIFYGKAGFPYLMMMVVGEKYLKGGRNIK
jgi:hypothetical protein